MYPSAILKDVFVGGKHVFKQLVKFQAVVKTTKL